MQYYIRQRWIAAEDYCDNYKETLLGHKQGQNGSLPRKIKLDYKQFNMIWTPETFTKNAFSIKTTSSVLITQSIYLHFRGNWCQLDYISRQQATNRCLIDLRRYPLDTQRCTLTFRSCECRLS